MKRVIQLDAQGYFVGTTTADEPPLEPGVYLMPADTVDAEEPNTPEGYKAKWAGQWVLEIVKQDNSTPTEETYAEKRAREYPPMADYLDGVVKGDQAQVQAYIDACLAVKAKYPKP